MKKQAIPVGQAVRKVPEAGLQGLSKQYTRHKRTCKKIPVGQAAGKVPVAGLGLDQLLQGGDGEGVVGAGMHAQFAPGAVVGRDLRWWCGWGMLGVEW